jgi:hypothetical protein
MYISTLMRITIFQNKLDQVSSKVKRLVSQKPKCIWGATKQNKWPKQDGQKRQMSPMPETIKFYNKMKKQQYHTVRTLPKSNSKITLFRNCIIQ